MIIHENKLKAEDFCYLKEAVGFGKSNINQIEICLNNSLYNVSVEVDNKIVGIGRLVGDGIKNIYIQDVFVNPEYQGRGIGKTVVKKLIEYINNIEIEDCSIMVGIMAAKWKEGFYETLGFRRRPNEYQGCGMMVVIDK